VKTKAPNNASKRTRDERTYSDPCGNHPWILLFFSFWNILLILFTELLIQCIAIGIANYDTSIKCRRNLTHFGEDKSIFDGYSYIINYLLMHSLFRSSIERYRIFRQYLLKMLELCNIPQVAQIEINKVFTRENPFLKKRQTWRRSLPYSTRVLRNLVHYSLGSLLSTPRYMTAVRKTIRRKDQQSSVCLNFRDSIFKRRSVPISTGNFCDFFCAIF